MRPAVWPGTPREPAAPMHFGKLPQRGDFVRSAREPALLRALDRWLSSGLSRLAAEADWKRHYDAALPMSFAFLAPRGPRIVAGHWMPSRDAAGRRFPYVTADVVERPDPARDLAWCPLLLAGAWARCEAAALAAGEATTPGPGLPAGDDAETARRRYEGFAGTQTLGSLETLFAPLGPPGMLRRTLLALGLLLRPVAMAGRATFDQGLRLPLPAAPDQRELGVCLWLALIGPFFARRDIELGLYLQPAWAGYGGAPALVLAFDGTPERALAALIDPARGESLWIEPAGAAWVDAALSGDAVAQACARRLEARLTPWRDALATFHACFLER